MGNKQPRPYRSNDVYPKVSLSDHGGLVVREAIRVSRRFLPIVYLHTFISAYSMTKACGYSRPLNKFTYDRGNHPAFWPETAKGHMHACSKKSLRLCYICDDVIGLCTGDRRAFHVCLYDMASNAARHVTLPQPGFSGFHPTGDLLWFGRGGSLVTTGDNAMYVFPVGDVNERPPLEMRRRIVSTWGDDLGPLLCSHEEVWGNKVVNGGVLTRSPWRFWDLVTHKETDRITIDGSAVNRHTCASGVDRTASGDAVVIMKGGFVLLYDTRDFRRSVASVDVITRAKCRGFVMKCRVDKEYELAVGCNSRSGNRSMVSILDRRKLGTSMSIYDTRLLRPGHFGHGYDDFDQRVEIDQLVDIDRTRMVIRHTNGLCEVLNTRHPHTPKLIEETPPIGLSYRNGGSHVPASVRPEMGARDKTDMFYVRPLYARCSGVLPASEEDQGERCAYAVLSLDASWAVIHVYAGMAPRIPLSLLCVGEV